MLETSRETAIARLREQGVPAHVGIIMDGNRRWARARGLSGPLGHRAGVERLRSVLQMSDDLCVKALSVYAFSSENWKRAEWEVNALMALLTEFMRKEIDELDKKNVRIRFMGEIAALPEAARRAAEEARDRTAANSGLVFNVALNYGGQAEIVRAARLACEDFRAGKIGAIDESAIEARLDTAGLPPVDLLIRTSGELRLSNFMLWQCAYAEFVFTEGHWPDFDDDAYAGAIRSYQARERRFGGR